MKVLRPPSALAPEKIKNRRAPWASLPGQGQEPEAYPLLPLRVNSVTKSSDADLDPGLCLYFSPPALGPVSLSDRTRELSQFEEREGKTTGYYAHILVP